MRIAGERAAEIVPALMADLAALGVGVVVGSGQGTIVDASDTFCRLVGYSLDELRALPHFGAFIAPDERAGIAARRTDRLHATSDGEPLTYRSVVIGPSGRRIPIETAAVTVDLGDSTIDVWVVHDMRVERDQADELDRLSALVDRMPIGAVMWGAAGVEKPEDLRLMGANRAASEAVGTDLSGRIGWRMSEVFPESTATDTGALILALRGTGRVEDLGEMTYGDEANPAAVYRRLAVSLPDDAVAVLFENVTGVRAEEIRRRGLLERLVDVGDEERRLLAMGVHDDPVQQLAAAKVVVESLRRRPGGLGGTDEIEKAEAAERLSDVESALKAAMVSLRRLVFELSPPELSESGLESAIRSAAEYLFDDDAEEVAIDVSLRREPSPTAQTAAFRIVAEALTNIRRHAGAGRVSVVVGDDGRGLRLEVADDGRGFSVAARPGHIGLRNMRERATALGGEFQIKSGSDGTRVTAFIPYEARLRLSHDDGVDGRAEVGGLTPGEVDALRRERDSLVVAATESLQRAVTAEGRIRDALAFAQIVLRPGLTIAEIVAHAAPMIGELLGDGCTVRLLSDDGRVLEPAASWLADPSRLDEMNRVLFRDRPVSDWHTGTAIASGNPVVLDLEVTPWLASDGPDPGAEPFNFRWGIISPLRIADDVFGTLTVMRERTGVPYDDRDVDFVQSLADGVSLALRIATRAGSGEPA